VYPWSSIGRRSGGRVENLLPQTPSVFVSSALPRRFPPAPSRHHPLPDAEGLQRELNDWGAEGWQLVAFEPGRDEHVPDQADPDPSPTPAYLAILKRLKLQ
jgi:hypothetical protein